jgi:hypothetical protein
LCRGFRRKNSFELCCYRYCIQSAGNGSCRIMQLCDHDALGSRQPCKRPTDHRTAVGDQNDAGETQPAARLLASNAEI